MRIKDLKTVAVGDCMITFCKSKNEDDMICEHNWCNYNGKDCYVMDYSTKPFGCIELPTEEIEELEVLALTGYDGLNIWVLDKECKFINMLLKLEGN